MSGETPDDASLLQAWRNGDRDAGTQLFRRHYEMVLRFFANKIGAEEQPDLIQRTFLGCVEGRDRIRDDDRFRSYLLNVAVRQLYRRYEQRRLDRERLDFASVSAADLDPSPSAMLAAKGDQQQLLVAMRSLPLELQVALELAYWEGLSATAIAEVVGVPVGTAKTRIRRARALLAEALAGKTSGGADIEESVRAACALLPKDDSHR